MKRCASSQATNSSSSPYDSRVAHGESLERFVVDAVAGVLRAVKLATRLANLEESAHFNTIWDAADETKKKKTDRV